MWLNAIQSNAPEVVEIVEPVLRLLVFSLMRVETPLDRKSVV